MNLEKLITDGVDRNIIVYDSISPGRMSLRLVCLMKTQLRQTTGGKLTTVFAPLSAWLEMKETIVDVWELGCCTGKLAMEGNDLYEQHGGLFPQGLSQIVVGVGDDGKVVLGAY